MNEETIGVLLAGVALLVFLWFTRRANEQPNPIGSMPPVAGTLASAVSPSDFETGPAYFIANQPYYFAPPVGNIMQPASASNTVATNIMTSSEGGCGCG